MRPARLIRNRLIGVARRVRARVHRLRPQRPATVGFSTVNRRLELLLNAMFGQPLGDGLIARVASIQPNERSIVLPASLPDTGDAIERYRLLAIEQGARIARGTRVSMPADPIERDLYMIVEGASIDAELVERAPRLSVMIARLRREELARRSKYFVGSGARPVEALLREVLAAEPSATVSSLTRTGTADESRAVARELAKAIRRGLKKREFYGPIMGVALWDDDSVNGTSGASAPPKSDMDLPPSKGTGDKPDAEETAANIEVSSQKGKRDDRQRPHEDTPGDPESRMDDQKEAPPDSTSDATAVEQSQAGAGASSNSVGAATADDAPPNSDELPPPNVSPPPGGIQYPEWVDRLKRLEPRYATVVTTDAPEGDGAWARDALRAHAPITRQLRDRFSLLRARRLRLRAQRSGDELDLDACVNALIDMQVHRVPSDRLYQSTRSSRHSLAITILVDVSGSTRDVLPDGQSVLDVERLSVLLASEALASLGDPFSILAFSGKSRHNVRVSTVKNFGEKDLSAMHRRVSSLEADDNTRLGAAVRHATSLLLQQNAHRRVLLILSDGRPHDVDWYWTDAAIEDSRVAILEARAAGVHSFCVTVDSKEATYLPHLFGVGRYWVLADPTELPKALIRLIDTIITG